MRKLILFLIPLSLPAASAWLYTQGSCSSFSTCQDCVVEYALDQYNLRRPCTWCPSTRSCEMMNQWSGYCETGETFRDTCPIMADDLPRCVDLTYSFWVCINARPRTANQCNQAFADSFCTPYTLDKAVTMCNSDSRTLETVSTGFGQMPALTAHKNGYGMEVNLEYFWLNAGAGEDRRRIEGDFYLERQWLCNAQMSPDQATVVQYRIDPVGIIGDDDDDITVSPPSLAFAVKPSTLIQVLMVLAPLLFLVFFFVEDAIDHIAETMTSILGVSPTTTSWDDFSDKLDRFVD